MRLHRTLRERFDLSAWSWQSRPWLRGAKRNAYEAGAAQSFRRENWSPVYHAPHLQELEREGYEDAKRARTRGPAVFCRCCRRPYQAFVVLEEQRRRSATIRR